MGEIIKEIIKTGRFDSENITNNTIFLYPQSNEPTRTFVHRVYCYINEYVTKREQPVVAVVDGIFLDARDVIVPIVESGEDPEKVIEELKNGKKEIDEQYGIVDCNAPDDREIMLLCMNSPGSVLEYQRDAVEFAQQHQQYHILTTSFQNGIYDTNELKQMAPEKVPDYVSDMYKKFSSITEPLCNNIRIMSKINDLAYEMEDLPRETQLKFLNELYEKINNPQKGKII